MWQRNFSKPAKGENTKVESSENSMQRKNDKHIRRPGISSRVDLKIKPKLNCSKPSLENNKTQTTQTQSNARWSVEFHSFFAPCSVAWANLAPVRPLAHFVATSAQERCRRSFQERNPAKQEPSHHHQDAPKTLSRKAHFEVKVLMSKN